MAAASCLLFAARDPDLCPPSLQALPGQTTPAGVPAFKLVLVGDGGTGEAATLVSSQLWRKQPFPLFSPDKR